MKAKPQNSPDSDSEPRVEDAYQHSKVEVINNETEKAVR